MASVHSYEVQPDPKRKGDTGKRWRVAYTKPDGKPTGKRGFIRKGEANAFANNVEEKKRAGDYIDPTRGRITVGELATEFLRTKKANVKKSSYDQIERTWKLHVQARWESVRVSDISPEVVEAWVTDMRVAAAEKAEERRQRTGYASDGVSTVRQALSVLVGILDLAVKGKRLPKNPARGVDGIPRGTSKRHVYLTAADVNELAVAAGQHRMLVLTLAYCGIRWGEAVALRVRDIDTARGRLHIHENAVQLVDGIHVGSTKSGRDRHVPVPRFILRQLGIHTEGLTADALVFPNPAKAGGYLPRPKTTGWFASAVRQAKIQRVTPHDLRHTCASLAVSAGANVMALSRMLGHSKPSMTLDIYSDLFDTDLDLVADAMNTRYAGSIAQAESEPSTGSCQDLVTGVQNAA